MRYLVAFALIVAVAGCGSGPATPVGPVATFEGSRGPGAMSYVHGKLVLDNGCLYVEGLDEPLRGIPVFAEDSVQWRDGELIFKGEAFAMGAVVTLAGGVSKPHAVLPEGVPKTCRSLPMVWVHQSSDSIDPDIGSKVVGAGGDPRVLVAALTDGGMDALTSGVLGLVGDLCVGLVGPGGPTLLEWPYGTTVTHEPTLRITSGGKDYELGDKVSLGGGQAEAGEWDPKELGVPQECGKLPLWLVAPDVRQ